MFGESVLRKQVLGVVLASFLVIINIAFFIDATTSLSSEAFAMVTEEHQAIPEFDQEILVAEVSIDLSQIEATPELEVSLVSEVSEIEIINTDQITQVEVVTEVDPDQHGTYRVVRGDSLYWIAERFNTSISELKKLNQLTTDTIHSNQILLVPVDTYKDYPVGVGLTDQEVQWIAQMVHAEARGEPYSGQVAVAAVIINRLKSRQFPNTVYEVLFQNNAFQPVRNGSFFVPANESAYRATIEALNGKDPTNGALFFFNPDISNDRFMHARPAVVTIGQHRFMY